MWKVGDVEPVRVMGAEGYPYGFHAHLPLSPSMRLEPLPRLRRPT